MIATLLILLLSDVARGVRKHLWKHFLRNINIFIYIDKSFLNETFLVHGKSKILKFFFYGGPPRGGGGTHMGDLDVASIWRKWLKKPRAIASIEIHAG